MLPECVTENCSYTQHQNINNGEEGRRERESDFKRKGESDRKREHLNRSLDGRARQQWAMSIELISVSPPKLNARLSSFNLLCVNGCFSFNISFFAESCSFSDVHCVDLMLINCWERGRETIRHRKQSKTRLCDRSIERSEIITN